MLTEKGILYEYFTIKEEEVRCMKFIKQKMGIHIFYFSRSNNAKVRYTRVTRVKQRLDPSAREDRA